MIHMCKTMFPDDTGSFFLKILYMLTFPNDQYFPYFSSKAFGRSGRKRAGINIFHAPPDRAKTRHINSYCRKMIALQHLVSNDVEHLRERYTEDFINPAFYKNYIGIDPPPNFNTTVEKRLLAELKSIADGQTQTVRDAESWWGYIKGSTTSSSNQQLEKGGCYDAVNKAVDAIYDFLDKQGRTCASQKQKIAQLEADNERMERMDPRNSDGIARFFAEKWYKEHSVLPRSSKSRKYLNKLYRYWERGSPIPWEEEEEAVTVVEYGHLEPDDRIRPYPIRRNE